MAREMFVAICESVDSAESARRDLEAEGIPPSDITIRTGSASAERPGFWERLFGDGHEDESQYYDEQLATGHTILSVSADSAEYDHVTEIFREHNLVRADHEKEMPAAFAGSVAPNVSSAGQSETVIPTAKEELQVGKRQSTDTSYFHVRRYVVERPVEEQVALHDETVTVERRQPAQVSTEDRPFEERTVEVRETREEPVVSKVVKPSEEVVVRKEGKDRTETVRGTVRESKVRPLLFSPLPLGYGIYTSRDDPEMFDEIEMKNHALSIGYHFCVDISWRQGTIR